MTSSEPKKQSPRERLRALYAAKFPDSPVPSRAGDRTLVQSSMTTETGAVYGSQETRFNLSNT